jgi:predicted ATPase
MNLERLRVKNFKSFGKLDVEFGDFNVIIGTNASGKSNFVSILKFLKDAAAVGIEDAISLQGGPNWIRNVNLPGENLEIEISANTGERQVVADFPKGGEKETLRVKITDFRYLLEVRFFKTIDDFRVARELLQCSMSIFNVLRKDSETIENPIDKGLITFTRVGRGNVAGFLRLEKNALNKRQVEKIFPASPSIPNIGRITASPRDLTILKGVIPSAFAFTLQLFLRGMQFFDIDPKLAKNPSVIPGKKELETDGRNLALVLNRALKNPKTRERLTTVVRDLLPFVKGFKAERTAERTIAALLKETYCKGQLIPSSLISDGTANLIALLAALLTGPKGGPPTIIEEPDRNLHPSLIAEFVEVLKDISTAQNRQLILTTHNPQIVKHSKIGEIYLISREGCFSKISKPGKSEEVKKFIQNEMGVDQLFVQNLLK